MKHWKRLYGLQATFVCPYCMDEFPLSKATIDHIQPRSRGGSSAPYNTVYSCKHCNNEKGSLNAEEYARWKETLDREEWKRLEFIRNGGLSQRG